MGAADGFVSDHGRPSFWVNDVAGQTGTRVALNGGYRTVECELVALRQV
jgi:hypothetical protein